MSEFIVEIDDEIPPPSEEIQCTLCPENLSDEHEFHKHNNQVFINITEFLIVTLTIIILCQIDSSNVDARSTPFQESCHRHFIKSTVTTDYHYPDWVCLVDYFCNLGWKIVGMAGYQTHNLRSQSGVSLQKLITCQNEKCLTIAKC